MPRVRSTDVSLTPVHPGRARECTVALLYDARSAYDQKVLTGVAAYLHDHGHVSLLVDGHASSRLPLDASRVQGIIADLNDPVIAEVVKRSRIPTVGFGGAWRSRGSGIPFLLANNAHIADLAADHLMAGGLVHFGYCGYTQGAWSLQRERAFVRRLQSRAFDPAVLRVAPRDFDTDAAPDASLAAWLGRLPKPVGIMAANDALGRQLLRACRLLELAVPGDVAVVGVDNDDLLCNLSSPPLSSIEQGARELGYAAATLLDRILQGEPLPRLPGTVNPAAVVVRRSSGVAAVQDPDVARALEFMAEHVAEGIQVADVVRSARMSRWHLEHRFQSVMHSSIASAIRHAQLRRARDLVSGTDTPLKQVASLAGFASVQYMTTVFAKAFGQTPAQYRRGVARS